MRIDDNNPSAINAAATGASQRVRAESEQSSPAAQPGEGGKSEDKVQFSNVASHVSAESLSINQSVSAERATRIEQLTKLVLSGQYHPDPEKIADSMIREILPGSGSS